VVLMRKSRVDESADYALHGQSLLSRSGSCRYRGLRYRT